LLGVLLVLNLLVRVFLVLVLVFLLRVFLALLAGDSLDADRRRRLAAATLEVDALGVAVLRLGVDRVQHERVAADVARHGTSHRSKGCSRGNFRDWFVRGNSIPAITAPRRRRASHNPRKSELLRPWRGLV